MGQRTAICTGVAGQDGSFLAEQLLEKGYKVYGLIRKTSQGIEDITNLKNCINDIEVVEGDILDGTCLRNLCNLAKPNLFFNMAAQSHVGMSFKMPEMTTQIDAIGVLNCLEAIRGSGIHTRFLQASTSELYGGIHQTACDESTPFYPKSPYGCAKLYAYWIVVNYRESYKMFACNSVCFNHESFRRPESFVTRKITKALAAIKAGKQDKLFLGNLDSKRDWSWAPDFTRGMIMMLEGGNPKDYVMASGETHSIREFCQEAFSLVGLNYQDYVAIDPQFYRPCEVDVLLGDASKIKNELGWKPEVSFKELVKRMVAHDLSLHGLSLN